MDTIDKLEKLQFLMGEWFSPMSGEPGGPLVGNSTFSFQLGKKIIVRNSHTEFAPESGANESLVHDDLLIIYQPSDGDDLRAIYFDNEGHTIHYTVSFPEKQKSVVFDSEATSSSPRARLVYIAIPNGNLEVEFFVSFSGDELRSHVKGILQKKV